MRAAQGWVYLEIATIRRAVLMILLQRERAPGWAVSKADSTPGAL